jgi:hypothetical protein
MTNQSVAAGTAIAFFFTMLIAQARPESPANAVAAEQQDEATQQPRRDESETQAGQADAGAATTARKKQSKKKKHKSDAPFGTEDPNTGRSEQYPDAGM